MDLAGIKVTQNVSMVIYNAAALGNQCMSWEGFWQNYKYANIQVSPFRHPARLTAAVEVYKLPFSQW